MADPIHLRNITIDTIHQKVHEGRLFSGGYYNASVNNGATLDILFQTDATYIFHGIANVSVGGDATMQMFEGVTFSAAGTPITMSNHNRTSAKVLGGGAYHTPAITGTGNQMNGTIYIPGGSGGNSSGGKGGFEQEYVLAASTNYLLRITNVSGVAAKMGAIITGYIPDL